MNLLDLIEEDSFNLKNSDTIGKLISVALQTNNSHVPIFEDKNFLGMINVDGLDSIDATLKISSQRNLLEKFYIMDHQSVLDAINFFALNKTNILPVINLEKDYVGVIKQNRIVNNFSNNYLFTGYGETILISIDEKKFSMKEISNIIEYNNGKIIGFFVTKIEQNTIEMCIKFTSTSLSSVGETFERYGYKIIDKFFEDNKQDLIKERYDYLINYIKK